MAKIKLSEIVIDPAVAIREGTDEDTIQRYMDTFDELPPIIVYQTDSKYLLADGFHRWAAATRLGKEAIEAEIRLGTYQEASEYAIFANLKHGRPLSREEYVKAIRRLSILHPNWKNAKGEWELKRFCNAIQRSAQFISTVFRADEVRKAVSMDTGVEDRTLAEISRAPEHLWSDLAITAEVQDWTVEETAEKVREIKAFPDHIDEILALEPPEPRETGEQLELSKLGLIFPKVNTYFANIATFRVQHRLTREFLQPYAPHIYTWRDAVNELIRILEG